MALPFKVVNIENWFGDNGIYCARGHTIVRIDVLSREFLKPTEISENLSFNIYKIKYF